MDRSDFASGNKEVEEAKKKIMATKPEGPAKQTEEAIPRTLPLTNVLPNGRAVGEGHAAVTHSLVPDSFIDKLNEFMPKK